MIFKEWLLNLNIWTLWLVDDSIKKQERSYFPPWTQLGNFGSYLSTVAYLMFWMKFYELLDLLPWNLAQTQSEFQNFNFFKCLLKYTHNRAARMLNLPPPPPFVFVFLPRTEFRCGISNAESVHISFWLESLVLDPQILSAHSDISWPFQTL